MDIDHPAVIAEEGARIVAAVEADRSARVPWSERWTVATVARHVLGTHHVVAQVIDERPDTDFGAFVSLEIPDKADPAFVPWCEAGTAALVAELRAVAPTETCWSWDAENRTVGFWARRMAHETVIHRWDAEAALMTPAPIDPGVAADGLDEYVEVLARFSRGLSAAPAGPSVGLVCTDVDEAWYLAFPTVGERVVHREPIECALTLRGSAEGLLLALWGRLDGAAAGVEVDGDATVWERWGELIPPL